MQLFLHHTKYHRLVFWVSFIVPLDDVSSPPSSWCIVSRILVMASRFLALFFSIPSNFTRTASILVTIDPTDLSILSTRLVKLSRITSTEVHKNKEKTIIITYFEIYVKYNMRINAKQGKYIY